MGWKQRYALPMITILFIITINISVHAQGASLEIDKRIKDELQHSEFVKVWIYLNSSASNDRLDTIIKNLDDNNVKLASKFKYENSFTAFVTKGGLEMLINNNEIVKIDTVEKIRALTDKSVPLIQADKAWTTVNNGLNITGNFQNICVIDTGVNTSHSYFQGKVLAQYCYCHNSPSSGCCPPNNAVESANAMDDNGHGTNVAGIALSNGTLKGVAPDSKLVIIKVLNASGSGYIDDLKSAVDWCVANKTVLNISAISISIGTGTVYSSSCDQVGQEVTSINNASTNNSIPVLVSSGNLRNTTGVERPACASDAIPVGAIYTSDLGREPDSGTYLDESSSLANCFDLDARRDSLACFTNRGSNLKLVAPGRLITSAGISGGNSTYTGTSQAAPHVAGLAALMKQANNSLIPPDIQRIMNYTGKPIYDPPTQLTFRRIDAFRSVLAVLYNLFVSDLQMVYSNAGNRIFQFKAFNDLGTTANVTWNISYGDGKSDASQNNVTLNGYQETFVFTSHDYSRPGNYTVTAYANTTNDNSNTLSMTIEVRPIEVNSLKLLNQSSLKNVYGFNIKSPESDLNVSWVFYPQNGVAINSAQNISFTANQTIFVYFEYNYTSTGTYNVTANATDIDKRYFDFNNITATVI